MAFKAYQKARLAQYDLIVNGIKDEQDTSNQIKLVEQVIVSKVTGMVIASADSKALVPLIDRVADQVSRLGFDERFRRMWRYYLAYCAAGFKTRRTDVLQAHFRHI